MANEYTEDFDTILQDTIQDLPGVIRAVAKRHLRLTLREFFEKSLAWTVTVKDIAIPTGEEGIQIDDADANTEVIHVFGVAIGDSGQSKTPLRALPFRPASNETTSNRPTRWFVGSNPDEVVLYPYPANALTATLTATVAVIPAFDTELLPRQITLKYHDAIIEGFLARMYGQPNKPYSAPLLSQQKRHNFLRTIGYYAAQRKKGYNNAPNWQFPRGWRVVPNTRSR